MMRALLAALLVLLFGSAARAERLIVSVSNHRVTVTPPTIRISASTASTR